MDLNKTDWSLIPEYMQGGMRRYFEEGIKPGSFLEAVLVNDLKEACGRADDTNRLHLFDYVMFLYNYAPSRSWGPPENYRAWIAKGGLSGEPKYGAVA